MKKETRRQHKLRYIRFKNNLVKKAGAKVNLDKTFKTCSVIGTAKDGRTIYQQFTTVFFIDPIVKLELPFPCETISTPHTTLFEVKIPRIASIPEGTRIVYWDKETTDESN